MCRCTAVFMKRGTSDPRAELSLITRVFAMETPMLCTLLPKLESAELLKAGKITNENAPRFVRYLPGIRNLANQAGE